MDVAAKVASVPHWRHRIPLPGGTVTPGSQDTAGQLAHMDLPSDLSGRTVLDIGASDGFFSFECERRGARRVVAVDNYSSMYIDTPGGFNVAHEILGSRVEFVEADLFSLQAKTMGQFDLVLFLGVLYHLRHPFLALERAADLCRDQMIMETEVGQSPSGLRATLFTALTGYEPPKMRMDFFPVDDINKDPTNWWAPTPEAALAMMEACGFCAVRTTFTGCGRGIFHGYSPAHGSDVDRVVQTFGEEAVKDTHLETLGRSGQDDIRAALRGLSISEFGLVKQALAERRSKRWHQVERWKQPGA